MSIIYVQTDPQDLFKAKDSFYAEAKVEITPDYKNGTFTVKVLGVRGYYYAPDWTDANGVKHEAGYNFRQYVSVWLDSTTSSDSTSRVSGSCEIAASGDNGYTGYMPKKTSSGDAVYQSISGCSKTFNYTANGNPPNVYLYIKSYNSSVHWISADKRVTANTHTVNSSGSNDATNIKNQIPSRDTTKPTIVLTQTKTELTKVGIRAEADSGFTIDKWNVQLCADNDPKKVSYSYNGASIEKEYTVINPTQLVYVQGRSSYNSQWSNWQLATFDCNAPTISNASLTPLATNKAKLSFTSNKKVYYKLTCSNPKIDSGWLGPVDANTSPNCELTVADKKNVTYKLEVKRYDNGNLTNSVTISCNTIAPVLTISNLNISGINVSFEVTSDVKCKDWTVRLAADDGSDVQETSKSTETNKIRVPNIPIKVNTPYTLTVRAKNVANNIEGSITQTGIKSLGVVYIKGNPATVYVYHNGWETAVPYMYENGIWKISGVD